MFKRISTILIWSEDWKKLSDWYQTTLDFKVVDSLDHPMDTGVRMELPESGARLWVGQHSQIKGQNKDPLRIMFNIYVDSVREAYDYLVSKGTRVIAEPFKAPTVDSYFATLSDPDGNTFQIVGQL